MIEVIKAIEEDGLPSTTVNTDEDGIPRKAVMLEGAGPTPEPVITELSVTENGTYNAPEGTDGYNPVTVDVPQTTVTALTITENGTYNAPEGAAYSPVVVNVPTPSRRVVCEYDFTTGSIDDVNRNNVKIVQTHTPQTVASGSGLLFDHNYSGAYPNYSFLPMKDYIIEVAIGNWRIQAPTSTFNNRFIGLDYKSYYGASTTNGLYLGYVPILNYDRTLSTPAWTVVNETSEDYFANKTFYIKLQNYYDDSSSAFKIKVLYSENAETWTDTNNDFTYLNAFYTLNIGSNVTKTNTDASTIKDFYLKKLKITEYDTNIIIN